MAGSSRRRTWFRPGPCASSNSHRSQVSAFNIPVKKVGLPEHPSREIGSRGESSKEGSGAGGPWRNVLRGGVFLHLPYAMSGILGTPVIVRQEMASRQKPRFIVLRPYLAFILCARLSFGSVVGCAASYSLLPEPVRGFHRP
jgi:hypothetical protein